MIKRKRKRTFWDQSRTALALEGSMLVALIVGIAFSIVTLVFYMRARNAHSVDMLTRDKIIKVNSRNADKLMIVAHPDDDAL